MMGQDGKPNQWDGNKNQCQNSMMGQDNKEKKWDDKQDNKCGCQNFVGKDGKQMEHRPIKSMMGNHDGKGMCHRPVKSMMGGHDGIKAVIVTVKIIE